MTSFGALMLISIAIFFGDVDGQSQVPQYSTRYNNLNIDQILSNERLVTNYVECLLSRKPCTPEGKDLKRILPEALRTKCARCSSQQYEGGLRVITKLYYDYPVQYNRLKSKWDPTGEYHRRFEEYLRGLQFNVINSESTTQSQNNNAANSPKNLTIVASPSSNSQSVVPTNLPSNTVQFNNTQRPARNPEIGQNQGSNVRTQEINPVPAGVFSRFGADDEDDSNSFKNQAKPSMDILTSTERISPTTATVSTQRATKRPSKRPNIVVNETPATTQPDVVFITQQHPLIGLINSIGFKISNTADFFAGMIRGTIQENVWFYFLAEIQGDLLFLIENRNFGLFEKTKKKKTTDILELIFHVL